MKSIKSVLANMSVWYQLHFNLPKWTKKHQAKSLSMRIGPHPNFATDSQHALAARERYIFGYEYLTAEALVDFLRSSENPEYHLVRLLDVLAAIKDDVFEDESTCIYLEAMEESNIAE
jgi:hypothetical protein